MRGVRRSLPCERRAYPCRHWASLNWWAWSGLAWGDYWWVTYEQYGGDE